MITSVLTTIGIAVVLWMWARSAKQAPEVTADGTVCVAYPPALFGFGLFFAAIGAGMTVAMLIAFPLDSARDVWGLIGFVGLFAGLVVPFLIEGRRRVWMNEQGLEGQLPGRTAVTIAWQELAAVRFSRWSGYLTLSAEDGRKVRVSPLMRGSIPLANLVRERGVSGAAEAVSAFHDMRRQYGF